MYALGPRELGLLCDSPARPWETFGWQAWSADTRKPLQLPSSEHSPILPSRQRPKGQMPTGYTGARNLHTCWFCPDLRQKKAWAVTCDLRQIAYQIGVSSIESLGWCMAHLVNPTKFKDTPPFIWSSQELRANFYIPFYKVGKFDLKGFRCLVQNCTNKHWQSLVWKSIPIALTSLLVSLFHTKFLKVQYVPRLKGMLVGWNVIRPSSRLGTYP